MSDDTNSGGVVVADGDKRVVREFVGPHGHAETSVERTERGVEIDLSPWVDEDGYGKSAGSQLVEKEFPGPVLVFEDIEWDSEIENTVASRVYVGNISKRRNAQTLVASFPSPPPEGDYSVTFYPQSRRKDGVIDYIDRDPGEVREELRSLESGSVGSS